ncbi:MAG: hypothetical protein GY696_16550 [Gammaproteobacteria bacterium]|nr:hypothetical protein [Gammaproteobacteria bacterium]
MALNSERAGTPLTPMSEGSDDLVSSLARLQEKVKKIAGELLVERRAWKASNAQSAGNSTSVGDPPGAAKQSLLLDPPSGSSRLLIDFTPDCGGEGSQICNDPKIPLLFANFCGNG